MSWAVTWWRRRVLTAHRKGSITERYIHASQVLFPGAAAKGEERLFGELVGRKV
ncbi:MAG: hypothetical protein H0T39_15230 [Actinobacteria bacterium]|nr:hypothetical protein [Actinomycetota bacterium]